MNEKTREVLEQKAHEIQQSLTEWCRQNPVFPEGTTLTVTINHQPPPLVQVKVSLTSTRRAHGRGVYYSYSSEITEADWKAIFELPLNQHHLETLEYIKSS